MLVGIAKCKHDTVMEHVMQRHEIFNLLVGHTQDVVVELDQKAPVITSDTYFVNIGASSCDRAIIAAETLDSLSLDLPLEVVLVANTLGEMVEIIYQMMALENKQMASVGFV